MTLTLRPDRRVRRPLASLAAGALTLALLPAGVATAQSAGDDGPRAIDRVCDAPDADFSDIAGSTHERAIRCLAEARIAEGRTDGTYGPGGVVTRAQMASFIARFIEDHTGEDLVADDEDQFDDVREDDVHADNIAALAAIGVVAGTSDDEDGRTYEPAGRVSRGQMATFIRRALSYIDDGDAQNASAPPEGEDTFGDDDGTTHEDNIDAIASQRIVVGFDGGDYRPGADVRRDQMAAFVMRAYDYAIEAGLRANAWEVLTVEGDTEGPAREDDTVTYTATGVTAEQLYRITLVDADLVDVDEDTGLATFVTETPADDEIARTVAAGPPEARIVSVNGEDHTPAAGEPDHTVGGVEPVEAAIPVPGTETITFEAEVAAPEDAFVALVHVDDGADAAEEGVSTHLATNAGGAPVEDFGVSAAVTSTYEVYDVTADDTEGEVTSFSATDLSQDLTYRIVLIEAEHVARDEDTGKVVFDGTDASDAPGTDVADSGAHDAVLLNVVGDEAVGDPSDPPHTIGGVRPGDDSTISFDVDTNGDEVVAVIHVDGGTSTFLELDADGHAQERFGVSGVGVVSPLPVPALPPAD
ncbi:MAG: S-layer homology domain-containing protein [Nitriliruptor sp.]